MALNSSGVAATSKPAPGLYVVATPIGNLNDITLRALEVLKSADMILCEDTRVTGKLLRHYGIANAMHVYSDYTGNAMRPRVLRELGAGKSVALVSDAGTPLISDPGYRLVNAARAQGIPIMAIPGPCAAIAALSISGLPTDRFLFLGFLPAKQHARRHMLEEVKTIAATLVFYERASRIAAALDDMFAIFGPRICVLARELTKRYEEVQRLKLGESAAALKGECVVLVAPPQIEKITDAAIEQTLHSLLKKHRLKEAVAITVQTLGCPRNRAYDIAVRMKG